MFAGDLHGAEVAEEGEGHGLGAEELLRQALDVGGGDGFDLGDDLLDAEEAAEVHLLAGEVGHAAAGGLSRPRTMLLLSWSLARLSSASETVSSLRRREFVDGELEDLSVLSTEVPA